MKQVVVPTKVKETILEYQRMGDEALWNNLSYFLERVVETADEVGVKLALHPDDPPWPVFGMLRIVSDEEDLARVLDLVDSRNNGLTFCTGSLGAGALSGTVAVGGGEPQPFEATEASGDAGVYAADSILDDDEHWGGWIVLHDGSQQGAAVRCTRNPLTGDRLYIPVHRR